MAISNEKQGEGKRNLGLWVVVILTVLVVAVIWWMVRGANGVPSGAVKAGEVAANGISFYGKEVEVYGNVAEPVQGQLFSISDGIGGTIRLAVIQKEAGPSLVGGERVLVKGTPMAFDAARIREVYGIEIPELQARGWQNQPVVIADSVSKLD